MNNNNNKLKFLAIIFVLLAGGEKKRLKFTYLETKLWCDTKWMKLCWIFWRCLKQQRKFILNIFLNIALLRWKCYNSKFVFRIQTEVVKKWSILSSIFVYFDFWLDENNLLGPQLAKKHFVIPEKWHWNVILSLQECNITILLHSSSFNQ